MRANAGFSILEITIAMGVVLVALGGLLSSTISSNVLNRVSQERARAYSAAVERLEIVQSTDFSDVYATYNAIKTDDPGGPGTAAGASFLVSGLDLQSSDTDGFVGEVEFPVLDMQLREDSVHQQFGMPMDLNGDDAIDSLDHADDYIVLPVCVRVRWAGISGDQVVELYTLLAAR